MVDPKEYKSKPFKCPKCSEKCVSKSNKAKDSTIVKRKPGRPSKTKERRVSPKSRERSFSIPSSQLEDRIANKVRSKRNIEELGSPETPEKEL